MAQINNLYITILVERPPSPRLEVRWTEAGDGAVSGGWRWWRIHSNKQATPHLTTGGVVCFSIRIIYATWSNVVSKMLTCCFMIRSIAPI